MQKPWKRAIRSEALAIAVLLVGVGVGSETRLSAADPRGAAPSPIGVCELLKQAPAYRGRLVTVTGVYWYGLRQVCREPIVTRGHTWPSALSLIDSTLAASLGEPVSFKTDAASWDKLEQLALSEGRAGRREEIWATITGVLRAPKSYVRDDGTVVGGYGHLGVFPAELVVKRVVQVSIKKKPTYDYRELADRKGVAR